MAKMKKIGVLTALIMLFAISLGVVTACSQGDYKVTFYDGETVEFTPEDVGYEKEGFAFDAWYATSDFTFDWSFDTEITENKNVYSSWYSTEPDTRQWTIAGESSAGGPLREIGWNGGISDANLLTKSADKNEFTITIDLYAGDKFQHPRTTEPLLAAADSI